MAKSRSPVHGSFPGVKLEFIAPRRRRLLAQRVGTNAGQCQLAWVDYSSVTCYNTDLTRTTVGDSAYVAPILYASLFFAIPVLSVVVLS